jgi:hypothetical protein
LLYRQSVAGKAPPWIARWLDQGKPPKIVALQRSASFKRDVPRVIRPDLLVTGKGLALTELDSVPGGIGLTAWLNQAYAQMGAKVIGGPQGMLRGFASIFDAAPVVHIVVSEESAVYRPEMEWLAQELNRLGYCCNVRGTEVFAPGDHEAVYRFFELFDLQNVKVADRLFEAAARKRILLTPAAKSFFEEKLLFALLMNRNLLAFWRQQLGAAFFDRLRRLVPDTWILDPAPLPPHAAIPGLELTDWRQLKTLSQKERELILKISGYSPLAWGARGVYLGSDLPASDWGAAVDKALSGFQESPHILQRYEKPKTVDTRWVDFEENRLEPMSGRVRLCPYYFVSGDMEEARAQLGGVLATICPANKKIIHGMSEAILAPCQI